MFQVFDPRHCPLYQDKLVRLLCVIVLIMNKKIILFMDESYLKYGGGFVAGTSNLWWDTTHKEPFVACVANFTAH